MKSSATCPSCGKHYQNLKPELAGKKVRCKCGTTLRVPQPIAFTDDLFDAPLPEVQPSPVQASYLPPSNFQQTSKPTVKRTKVKRSEKGHFRPIDFFYMFSGGIVFLAGLRSILGILGSLVTLPALMTITQQAPGASSEIMGGVVLGLFVGLIGSVLYVLLGFFAGAMGYYVYEKRTTGKSEYSWAFGYGAVVAIVNMVFVLVNAALWTIKMMSISSEMAATIGVSYFSLILAPLPVLVLVMYALRHQLGFKELSTN